MPPGPHLTADDVMPLVLEACPSFRATWEEVEADHAAEEPGARRLHYLDASAVARHVLGLVEAGTTDELPALFAVVERLHVEGDPYVRELATIGYLEDVQTAADRAGVPDEVFAAWLGAQSAAWWRGVRAFWDGELPAVRPLAEGESASPVRPPARWWWRRS